jgi:hypothetical protein
VHGVGGDALGGVDGGGIAEAGGGTDVVGGQPDRDVAASVPNRQVALLADLGDGPAVAVFDPVGGGETESAVVGPGDDHVSDTGLVSVGQEHFGCRRGAMEPMSSGTAVEFVDKFSGGGEHDRVEPRRSVGNPRGEGILRGGGPITDMNTAVIKVELQPRRVALADGE